MKTKISASIISFLFFTLVTVNTWGQAPEKLTYQGVARTANGETLKQTNIEIKFGIHAGSEGGVLVWEETHAKTTNEFGLFTSKIGDGTTTGGGTLSSFSEIDWATTQYFLNVQMKVDATFEEMGTSEMLSVPYAMFAKYAASSGESTTSYWIDGAEVVTTTVDVGIGTPSPAGKLEVQGDGDEMEDDPLFQVKRKDGETVFAVYPGGVRINVDDSGLKGTKGGFAVGGFNPATKGLTNDYLWITPDSVRIYVDEFAAKGTKGGFAVGGFTSSKADPTNFVHLTPDNYFIGHRAGSSITTGLYNSFVGYEAGVNTEDGSSNVFIGHESGLENLTGNWNVFIGNNTGRDNTFGSSNIMIGDEAGISNTEGNGNVMMGDWAGYSNTDGSGNVLIGIDAGFSNTTGDNNAFIGPYAGAGNTIGDYNVFMGVSAGEDNVDGNSNTYLGAGSGWSNVSGSENVFVGMSAGSDNTGNNNTFVGSYAGETNASGENNVFIGYGAGQYETGSGLLYIDNANMSAEPLIYGEFSITDPYFNINAFTDITGNVEVSGTINELSDQRLKTDIEAYGDALDHVSKLQGVKFNWKKNESMRLDPDDPQIGLVAQEVEEIIPQLVNTDREGYKSVSYSKLTVVLLEAIKEQQKMIEELQREVELLKNK